MAGDSAHLGSRVPQWTAAALSVWGKSSREDDSWLPVVTHLEDSAAIAGHLWDEWIAPAVKRVVADGLGTEDAQEARTALCWLAGIHDVGKATPAFAIKMPSLLGRMADSGLRTPVKLADAVMMPHGLAGQIVLRDWLVSEYAAPLKTVDTFACIVGGHHGVPPGLGAVGARQPTLLGDGPWADVQVEILRGMAARTGADIYLPRWAHHALAVPAQVLLTALVIVADWLASDDVRFPYGEPGVTSPDRAERAWEELGMPPMWSADAPPRDPDELIRFRFGFTANEVQQAVVEAAWTMPEPGLLIVEAPMGRGKTEAALAAAEVLAHRFGMGGTFVALPTMATSNAMFERVRRWVDSIGGGQSMFLAHGKAHLNETFRGLALIDRVSAIYDEGDDERVTAGVMSWLTGRKKGPLANMVVGTIDQVLTGALQAKHLVLRQLALASKVVVVDEVHAADAYMRIYLASILQWLAALGTPVVLLSATLPGSQRADLIQAYRSGRGERSAVAALDAGYPMVTAATTEGVAARSLDPGPATTVALRIVPDGDVVELVLDLTREGGCVAVICNTVGRAQEIAATLRSHLGHDVVLLHSRFTALDRAERERALVEQLGPGGARPRRRVVVGTQVLEQSLDIDVDAMVSDLAPADSLMQRVGRLHRHDNARPSSLQRPVLWVAGIAWSEEPDEPPEFPRGSVAVYGRAPLLRCAATLHTYLLDGRLDMPQDISAIVTTAYESTAEMLPWSDAIATADLDDARKSEKSRRKAKSYVLARVPRLGKSLNGSFQALVGGAPEDGRAQVRDSEDGLEVIAVQRRADGVLVTMPGDRSTAGRELPEHAPPDHVLERALAADTLRLPLTLTHLGVIDDVIAELERSSPEGWIASRWLSDELVLIFDHEMHTTLAGHELRYDKEQGLLVRKNETA